MKTNTNCIAFDLQDLFSALISVGLLPVGLFHFECVRKVDIDARRHYDERPSDVHHGHSVSGRDNLQHEPGSFVGGAQLSQQNVRALVAAEFLLGQIFQRVDEIRRQHWRMGGFQAVSAQHIAAVQRDAGLLSILVGGGQLFDIVRNGVDRRRTLLHLQQCASDAHVQAYGVSRCGRCSLIVRRMYFRSDSVADPKSSTRT